MFVAGIAATGILFFLWIMQTPSITYVRHYIVEDLNNYPQKGEIVLGKIFLNDKFSLSVTLKNEGYLPIYNAFVSIDADNNIELDSQEASSGLRKDKALSPYRQVWGIPVGTLRAGASRTVYLKMSSMAIGTMVFKIETRGLLPSLIKKSAEYPVFIDTTLAATTVPFRRGDVHTVLQFRAYSICQQQFPCKNTNSDGSCASYPNSDDASRSCVIAETKKNYDGCETKLYDEQALNLQMDCLIRKHGFEVPLSE